MPGAASFATATLNRGGGFSAFFFFGSGGGSGRRSAVNFGVLKYSVVASSRSSPTSVTSTAVPVCPPGGETTLSSGVG